MVTRGERQCMPARWYLDGRERATARERKNYPRKNTQTVAVACWTTIVHSSRIRSEHGTAFLWKRHRPGALERKLDTTPQTEVRYYVRNVAPGDRGRLTTNGSQSCKLFTVI